MFEPKLAAERKVSFERDGLDASKACHISARGNVRSRAAGSGSAGPEAGKLTKCDQPLLPWRFVAKPTSCSFLSAVSSREGGAN